jgi:hypothetical protein
MPSRLISGIARRVTQQIVSNKIDRRKKQQNDNRRDQSELNRNRC